MQLFQAEYSGNYNIQCMNTGGSSYHGLLGISDTRVIFFGVNTSPSKGLIINVDPTPSTPTNNWQKLVDFPGGGSAVMSRAVATTNTDKSRVYAALPIGGSSSSTFLLFMVIEESTGSLVGESFVSSDSCVEADKAYYYSDKVYILG